MPSNAWRQWHTVRARELDELEAAHAHIGGTGRGRRYATQQINRAYAVLLASQFQGFCRDLHTESVDALIAGVVASIFRPTVRKEYLRNRSLDRGNASPGNIGTDFNRLGLEFWTLVYAQHARNQRQRELLEELNTWRNAIAHQDFDPHLLGGTTVLHRPQVRRWRSSCRGLARFFDRVMRDHIKNTTGNLPW
jgi:hypothetical protein